MKKTVSVFLFLVVFLSPTLYADRGSIPFNPNVKIFEPNQRAMIAWNGEEEILLLTTDLRASAPTKVLEVIPLPSKPEVKRGDIEVFKRATALINKKIRIPISTIPFWRPKSLRLKMTESLSTEKLTPLRFAKGLNFTKVVT